MNRTVDLTIDSIAAGGDGVGRVGALVIFVPRAAPGDAGRVRIADKGRFARGEWESIEKPGIARIDPPCRHYVVDRCGGCQLQHIQYASQLDAKGGIISDAIQRIGKRSIARPQVHPSPRQWRYRRKLTLAMRRRGASTWIAGLHPYDAPGRVFNLDDCPITDERVLQVWQEIRSAAAFLPDTSELRGAVQINEDGGELTASFTVEGAARWPAHASFFDTVRSLGALWWRPENGVPRLMKARAAGATASFAQVNDEVAADLQAYVLSLALARAPRLVIDAYAGRGDTAAALAATGARTTAIELDREAAAVGAARLAPPSRMITGRVEDELARLLPADLVVLNPPRTGVHERVTDALARSSATPTIIYISCNPATLARDIARLPGYRIATVAAFDMFPQTAHVETVCELVPEAA